MEEMTIYHNPRCAKSRETLQRIRDAGIEPVIVHYLKEPPSKEKLRNLIDKLKISPLDLVRKEEKFYKENFREETLSEDEWIEVLHNNPRLIQRPVVEKGDEAIVGRPPENMEQLL